jgi:RNA polymerase sigma factor (sigma-70 family)
MHDPDIRDQAWLAAEFERNRGHLHAVAYRMLGSMCEADDVVQDAWLRLGRADAGDIGNPGGWLTTVVARVCLDQLRARKQRGEEFYDPDAHVQTPADDGDATPEREAMLADAMGPALLVLLDTLAPAERLAFVLHDLFGMSFDEIAPIVDRTPVAARQLASRARRRVQGAPPAESDVPRQRRVVDAFLSASRNGDFAALLAVLDPDVVLRADAVAQMASVGKQAQGAPELANLIRGADAVARTFSGRAHAVRPALVAGAVGAAYAQDGIPRAAFAMRIAGDRIVAIEVISDPRSLAEMGVVMFEQ